ncbi:MAG TPA: hypothetical protein VMU99_08925 [Acidimicrobiales bacterium]|nr:hypothetical protein [Acidimicrobiales bacterium]
MPPPTAYDLVTSAGDVQTFGGAGFFGSRVSQNAPTRVIGGASTADGLGYWLFSNTGGVFTYGDALDYGSPREALGGRPRRVRASSATPDAQGYWMVTPTGGVFNYGDAAFCGSATGVSKRQPIAAIAPTPDGGGYWLVTTNGVVIPFGDAKDLYGHGTYHSKFPIVAMSSTPDGNGYWLCNSRGAVFTFGDAVSYGSTIHRRLTQPIVSFVPTPDGDGYWLTTETGRIYRFGDAGFHGSDLRNPPQYPTTIIGMIRTIATSTSTYVPLPHHTIGYDISNFQCKRPGSSALRSKMPARSAIGIIEVAGWLDGADNPCLASAASWATQASGSTGASYELYLFLNAPGTNIEATRLYANGPKGSCGSLSASARLECIAYNYGYNGAQHAVLYANRQGVHAVTWWVDIENKTLSTTAFSDFGANEFWSGSIHLNALTVQGAFDALRAAGIEVGIYSSSLQYPKIVGNYRPRASGPVPLWVAGVPWTNPPYPDRSLPSPATLADWCAGTASYLGSTGFDTFAGGVPWILQETPGASNAPNGLDPDYSC